MIIKFTSEELAELRKHATGGFGQKRFHSFLSELDARTDDSGEVDIDRDDLQRIQAFEQTKYKRHVEKIFKRPVVKVLKEFFDRS